MHRIEELAPETVADIEVGTRDDNCYPCGCSTPEFYLMDLCTYHQGYEAAYQNIAVEFADDGGTAYLMRRVRGHRDRIRPPYLFPENATILFPGMRSVTVNEAIRDVWTAAHDSVIDAVVQTVRRKGAA